MLSRSDTCTPFHCYGFLLLSVEGEFADQIEEGLQLSTQADEVEEQVTAEARTM